MFANASAQKTHFRDSLMYSDQGSLHSNSSDLLLESLENDIERVNGPSAGLPGVMQAQENDIRNFSSMALQDSSGHVRTPNSASGLRDDGYGATAVEQGSREAYGAKVAKIAKAREARDEPKPEPFVHKSIPPGGLNGIEVEGETVTHTVWESQWPRQRQ